MSPLTTILFAAGTAFFYMTASWVTKAWGVSPYAVFVPALLLTLAVGARVEMQILQNRRLARTILAILAVEAAATGVIAFAVLGDAWSPRDAAGVIAVFTGIALIGMAPARQSR